MLVGEQEGLLHKDHKLKICQIFVRLQHKCGNKTVHGIYVNLIPNYYAQRDLKASKIHMLLQQRTIKLQRAAMEALKDLPLFFSVVVTCGSRRSCFTSWSHLSNPH